MPLLLPFLFLLCLLSTFLPSFLPFWPPPLFVVVVVYHFPWFLRLFNDFDCQSLISPRLLSPRPPRPALPLCVLPLPLTLSLSVLFLCFRFRAGNNFSNFLRLFVYVSTVFGFGSVQLSLASAQLWGEWEVRLALRAILTLSPSPPSPRYHSFCLLLMRLLTLINVFSYHLCLWPYWIWVSVAIWNSFYCSHVERGRGITSITRIVPGAAFIKFIKNIHFDRSATPAITITLTIKTETGSSRSSRGSWEGGVNNNNDSNI